MMQFHTSHAYVIGDTHRTCQDYATGSAIIGRPLVVVSDGCSGAADSDVGARVVALTANRLFTKALATGLLPHQDAIPSILSATVQPTIREFGLKPTAAAATLLAAFVFDNECNVYLHGDGVWYKRFKDGRLEFTIVSSPTDQPQYPCLDQIPRDMIVSAWPSGNEKIIKNNGSFRWHFPVDGIAEFGIATDGITATNLTVSEVLERITGTQNVAYLLDRFRRESPKPYLGDDIGIGVIAIE